VVLGEVAIVRLRVPERVVAVDLCWEKIGQDSLPASTGKEAVSVKWFWEEYSIDKGNLLK